MLRITLLSGEELASLPLTELSDVKALKQRLHQQHGLPPRFRQRLLHDGNPLDDDVQLDTEMDLQAVIAALNATSEECSELCEAAASGRVAQAGCALLTSEQRQLLKSVNSRMTQNTGITYERSLGTHLP